MTVMTKPETTTARTLVDAPTLTPNATRKPKLISVEEAKGMDVVRMTDLFKAHQNPGQLHFMKLLGFHKIKVERAEGMYYIDQNGRKILDFFGGFGSLAFGHNHPRLLEARKKFQDEKRHEIAIAFMSQYQAAFAHNLAACSPGDLDMVFLGSSGSEAMEAAVKIAERAAGPKRPKIVYAENSFHGKTKGVLSITDGQLYRGEFKLTGNTVKVPFGDIDAIENAFKTDPEIGVIVLETIQGGGGIIQAAPEFWTKLRALCDQYGVIWVADEVQCGYGRTGKFFAYEWSGIEPDIMAVAKGIGAGFPLGACLAKGEVAKSMIPGTHGSTYGGNPLASAMGNAVLDRMLAPGFFDHVDKMGQRLNWHLQQLAQRFPSQVLELRGKGLLAGIRIASPVRDVAARLRDEHHMLAMTANENVLRLLPPLVVTEADIEEAVGKLAAVFEAIEAEAPSKATA